MKRRGYSDSEKRIPAGCAERRVRERSRDRFASTELSDPNLVRIGRERLQPSEKRLSLQLN